ncbi:MAG TPA: hypothetical protein VN923_07170, partial [Thermoanaerobaculia bacterium]|nr:hypothetical protein [Thermoanaerobaculia bacterium]
MRHPTAAALALAMLAVPRLAGAATVDVSIVGFSFSPQTVNVEVGDTVRWTNGSGNFHDVTADDHSFSGGGTSSWTFSHTFAAPGTVGYHCSFHGGPGSSMFGTVVVNGGPPGNPPAAPSGLVATPQSTTEVELVWTDNANDETGFRVERRTVDGTF